MATKRESMFINQNSTEMFMLFLSLLKSTTMIHNHESIVVCWQTMGIMELD